MFSNHLFKFLEFYNVYIKNLYSKHRVNENRIVLGNVGVNTVVLLENSDRVLIFNKETLKLFYFAFITFIMLTR